jgi:endonuclease YncB( thermonuclease family)
MMKKISLFLLVVFLSIATRSTAAQILYAGKVVDIIDGKTVVLEIPSGKMRVVLQYIDVPEPEQPLHQTVVDHLAALTRGKQAEFRLVGIATSDVSGQLLVGGVDVSMQMLRDGAAWHLPSEISGQPQEEFAVYKSSEDSAQSEKLGVWSMPNFRPAWKVRAEREEELRRELLSRPDPQAKLDITSEFQTIWRPGRPTASGGGLGSINREAWLDVFARTGKEAAGVHTYEDTRHGVNSFYTSGAFVNLTAGETKQRLECRAALINFLLVNGTHRSIYVIGFRTLSDDYNFSKHASGLTLNVDGRVMSIRLWGGLRGRASIGAEEIMFYQVSASMLKKIASARNVQIRINNFTGSMDKSLQSLIGQPVAGT